MASQHHAAVTTGIGIGRVAREVLAVGAGLGALIGAASVLANLAFPGGSRFMKPQHISCVYTRCMSQRCDPNNGQGCGNDTAVCIDPYAQQICYCVCLPCFCPQNH
jgi:hypothetical protein